MMEVSKKWYNSPRISSEYKDCSTCLTFDQYNHCTFGCQYCFAAQFKECNPAYKGRPFEVKTVNPKRIISIIKGERPEDPLWRRFFKDRFVFHWGGLNDPFCYYEKKIGTGLQILETLAEEKYPTLFSTKGMSLFLDDDRYMDIFRDNSKYKNFAFQFSIITNGDELSEKIEPHTPNTSERLRAMKAMSDLGYWTILRLRPFIIGISDIELETLLVRAKEAGCNAISTEFFAIDGKSAQLLEPNLKLISELVGYDILEMYRKTSPKERGTYMRMNRDVKESYIKRIYTKCKELGLLFATSDPDFKELNQTGCCCSLPDVHKDNPELTNWTKGQLSHHLRLLRERYYKSSGKDKYLKFEDIEKDVFNNWYDENNFLQYSIKFWNVDYRYENTGYKHEFIMAWNRLANPDNPYKYFHGTLKPSYVDDRGLMVYEYSPRPYEKRWMKEGIL